jgi:predicted Zn-dependent protease
MRYRNPKIPEGINVSPTNPMIEFASLLAAVVAIGVGLALAAYLLAGWLVPYIPFSVERAILDTTNAGDFVSEELTESQQAVEDYLQLLAQRLLDGTEVPEDFGLQVHYSDSEQMNAYATLGGHIVINRGLLSAVQSENGLAMVLGHEIGHLLHRDPMLAMGRATVTASALALLGGFSQTSVANTLFSISADSLMLGFSREQERAADMFSLGLLQRYYGHQGGADEFFKRIKATQRDSPASDLIVEFFSTHPDLEERIEQLQEASEDSAAALVGLPITFRAEQ